MRLWALVLAVFAVSVVDGSLKHSHPRLWSVSPSSKVYLTSTGCQGRQLVKDTVVNFTLKDTTNLLINYEAVVRSEMRALPGGNFLL